MAGLKEELQNKKKGWRKRQKAYERIFFRLDVFGRGTDCGGVGHGAAVRGGGGGDGAGGRRGGSPYSQILRGEAAQARQTPPGGRTVELLHLLRQLLLQTPLLLVLLRVGELHHDGRRAALRGRKRRRGGGKRRDGEGVKREEWMERRKEKEEQEKREVIGK